MQDGDAEAPVTPEEYKLVDEGKGTPEQIARVRKALADQDSPLRQWLGVSGGFARMAIERKYMTPEEQQRVVDALTPVAQKNMYRVIEYLRHKRETGALTPDEVNTILKSTRVKHLEDPRPTPTHYAMCVSRMTKALIKLHPELASEVRALPISRER